MYANSLFSYSIVSTVSNFCLFEFGSEKFSSEKLQDLFLDSDIGSISKISTEYENYSYFDNFSDCK